MTDEGLHDLNAKEQNEASILPKVGLYTCPMCQGKGVCTRSATKFERNISNITSTYQESLVDHDGFWLPRLLDLPKNEAGLRVFPEQPSATNTLAPAPAPSAVATVPVKYVPVSQSFLFTRHPHRSVSTPFQSRKYAFSKYEPTEDIWPGMDREMLSAKAKKPLIHLRDMQRELPKAIYRWEDVVQGLQGVVQVSRWQPVLIEPYMPVVNRALLSLLRGLRSHVTRLACQVAGELFRTMQCTGRPEFDELVGALLVRTADLNRFIRQDANEALDAMVTYLSPQPCVRALLAKGCSHKHPLVRTATARLLTCCSVGVGPGGLLSHCSKRDARKNLLCGAASLLSDPNQETRLYAKKLFGSLVQHEDFDSIFQSCVDEKLLSHVEKTVALIKYAKHSPL